MSSQEDVEAFHNMLALTNMKNTFDKLYSEEALEPISKEINDLLNQHGLDQSVRENNRELSQLAQKDIRFEKPLTLENFYKQKLKEVEQTNLDIWNPVKQQETFNELVAERNETIKRNSEDNVKVADEIASTIENATDIDEINKAINGSIEEIVNDKGDVEIITPEIKPIDKVDKVTAEVLKEKAKQKTAEKVIENEDVIDSVNSQIKEEIKNGNIKVLSTGKVVDLKTNSFYDSIEDYENSLSQDSVEDLPIDTNIHPLDEDDKTNNTIDVIPDDIDLSKNEEKLDELSPELSDRKAYPGIATIGIYTGGNKGFIKPDFIPDAFYNFINNFKSVVDTPVTFSIPTNISNESKDALELFNLKKDLYNEKELDTMYKYLPIQINIENHGNTFIQTITTNKITNNDPAYIGRKNIVDALITTKDYSLVTSKIQYQKGGIFSYDKTTNEKGEIINNNKITSLKEFQDNPLSVPLYIVKDENNLYDENANLVKPSVEFPAILANATKQKGYTYTIIHSPGGIATPVKLNVRKMNNTQSEMIYNVYKQLHDYNTNRQSNERVSQYVAKLKEVLDSNFYLEIQNNFSKEFNIFNDKDNITVADFMTLFIHDNVDYKGETKPYTTKYQGGELLVGKEALLNFDNPSTMSQQEFVDFLIKNKRQNIKLSYLAGENSNVNKDKYKEYLLNDITSVNIDTQQPFKGDINVYIDSKVNINKKSNTNLEKISENIRNSQKESVSSLPITNKAKGIDMKGFKKKIKPSSDLNQEPPTKC